MIGQAVGLMANSVHAKILTVSEACAAEAKERGIAVDLDQAWNSGIDPVFSKRIWWHACREAGRLPAAVITIAAEPGFLEPCCFQVLRRPKCSIAKSSIPSAASVIGSH